MPSATISPAAPRRTRSRRRRAHRSAAVSRLVDRLPIRIVVAAVLLVAIWAAVNWMVQVARKPTEVFFPVSESFVKAPAQTWREYGPLFVKHSTTVITPQLLAALAQVESSGNSMARTYWRWRPIRARSLSGRLHTMRFGTGGTANPPTSLQLDRRQARIRRFDTAPSPLDGCAAVEIECSVDARADVGVALARCSIVHA